MQWLTLGGTGIRANKNGFGALPIQRVGMEEAAAILQEAYAEGINFFDTARMYTDSEEKIGRALGHVRQHIVLATKTTAINSKAFWKDLETSLQMLKTDMVDILQFHNPAFCPKPGDGSGLYEAALKAKEKGLIQHIGITSHSLAVAKQAVESGLYATLQFPFSYLASGQEVGLAALCAEKNMGFIAMKALCGGLITDGCLAYAFMQEHPHVLPIWGIQRRTELRQFCSCAQEGVRLTPDMSRRIEEERQALCGEFCRGCGYCMPCPAGIEINNCARMSLMLRRAPSAAWTTPAWQEKMGRIPGCLECGQCVQKCPYSLSIPQLLRKNYADYQGFIAEEA